MGPRLYALNTCPICYEYSPDGTLCEDCTENFCDPPLTPEEEDQEWLMCMEEQVSRKCSECKEPTQSMRPKCRDCDTDYDIPF